MNFPVAKGKGSSSQERWHSIQIFLSWMNLSPLGKGEAVMPSLMIVGGDHLGKITKKLQYEGIKEIIHVSGRKARMSQKEIPSHVNLVLVLTDFINHEFSAAIKKKANKQNIPIYFSKRSWCSIYAVLEKTKILNNHTKHKKEAFILT